MKYMRFLESRYFLLVLASCIGVLCAFVYVRISTDGAVGALKVKIAEQKTTLATLAEVTDRDGADSVVERIIKDCNADNRARFDTQLSRLQSLTRSELLEVEQLFEACGNFFAERKAVMVARLTRELSVYTSFIDVFKSLRKSEDTSVYTIDGWEELVELEAERSELSSKLVDIQGTIIRELKAGTTVQADSLQSILVEGQRTREALFQVSEKIDMVRSKLLNL
jgi:hypothetical protein